MKKLLHLKHWQLFLLTYGVLFALQFVLIISMFFFMQQNVMITGTTTAWFVPVLILVGLFCGGLLYAWMWTMGTELYKKLPEGMEMNVGFFKFALIFPFAYIVLIFLFIAMMASSGGEPSPLFVLIIIPHLFTMFCMFYVFWFNAKALKSVELGRRARSGDYIGEFFLMWFLFIGMWFIQPKLNEIFGEQEDGVEQHLVG